MQKQMTGKRKEMCITERYMCRRSKNNRVADRITGQCENIVRDTENIGEC